MKPETYAASGEPRKAVVIGVGLAGLVAIKSCLEEGMDVQAFESSHQLGGNWRFKEDGVSVFRNTELTSSKYITAFSDFQAPRQFPHFLMHDQYLDYLFAYARHFDLDRHVEFGTRVTAIRQRRLKWSVQISRAGAEHTIECDAIAVCTGLNEERNFPDVHSMDEFRGRSCIRPYIKTAPPSEGARS